MYLNFTSLLKYANKGVSFHPDNQHLVLLDEWLLKTIRIFHYEIEGNVLKRDGENVFLFPMEKQDDALYFDFTKLTVNLDFWLSVVGYQNIITAEYHLASEKDKAYRQKEDGFPLLAWVVVYFESDMKRIHFIGVDQYGNIGEEIQVPFETVGNPAYEATWDIFKDWVSDIQVSLYDNFAEENDR